MDNKNLNYYLYRYLGAYAALRYSGATVCLETAAAGNFHDFPISACRCFCPHTAAALPQRSGAQLTPDIFGNRIYPADPA